MLNQDQINNIIEKIKRIIKPKCIYIFGSYIYGKPNKNSDLDLLIIKKNKISNKLDKLIRLKKNIISDKYSVDVLLYSEKEFNNKVKEGWKIFDDILTKGKKINV